MHRHVASAGSTALAFGTVLALALVDGGFFAASWPWATIGLAAAAAIALLLRTRVEVAKAEIAMVVGLAAFAAWVRLSGLWADDASSAPLEAERALVYVAGALAAAVVATRTTVPFLLAGIVGAATVVSVYSIVDGAPPGASLEGPIGYANALGILAAIGILLAVALALRTRRRLARAALGVTTVPLAMALGLTGSRGSAIALVFGLGAALALAPRTRLLIVGAAAVAATAAAAFAVGAFDADALKGGDRPDYWRVALSEFEERPLVGRGAGSFHAYWQEHRPDPATLNTPDVLDAHSLYFETLAELGVVGLALVVAVLAVPIVVGIRQRGNPVAAAALPAYIAFVVHAGLDWDWEMPAVTLTGIFCGVAVLAAARDAAVRPLPPWGHGGALAAVLGLLVVGFLELV